MLAADAAASDLAGLDVVDRRGERLGRVRQVYPHEGRPAYVGVRGNLFGTEEVLVPLEGAEVEDDVIGVPVTRARFQTAPRRRPDARLDDDERRDLRAFWAEPAPAAPPKSASPSEPEPEPLTQTQTQTPPASTPPADPAPDEAGLMTASEERLRVDTERVPRTRVRLRKVVVTEQRTVTVPVRREEYRLIREPITDGEPVAGGVIGPDEQEVVLYEERIVVSTEVVPVERIRLVKEEVVDTCEVTGEVRRERIDLVDAAEVDIPAVEPEVLPDESEPDESEPVEAEVLDAPRELEAPRPQPAARAMATKRSTSSRSPRKPASTPARSSTSAAAAAPPSTGAND